MSGGVPVGIQQTLESHELQVSPVPGGSLSTALSEFTSAPPVPGVEHFANGKGPQVNPARVCSSTHLVLTSQRGAELEDAGASRVYLLVRIEQC